MQNILHLSNITKKYPNVVANDNITIEVKKGEVHSILGENGAGKTTLMKIIYGICKPDEGEIYYLDNKVEINSPKDAIELGLGMVHQHFMLINAFTVLENIVLSTGGKGSSTVFDENQIVSRINEISEEYDLSIDPHAKISDISVGQQQRVEILKALYQDCQVLILDEPTAVLTPSESQELMRSIELFKSQGKSVIFISHKLKEVMEISDTITVLRDGKVVDTVKKENTAESKLVSMMVGRDIEPFEAKIENISGKTALEVDNITINDKTGRAVVKNLSLNIKEGEIYGLAGVDGNGQKELVKGIAALMRKESGTINILGQNVTEATPKDILKLGVSHIPEDRQTEGLIMDLPLRENLILNSYDNPRLKDHKLFLSSKKISGYVSRLIKEYLIKTPNADLPVSALSGGNQQKAIVARALDSEPKVLLAVHATRGVDIGAVEFIHKKILEARDEGCAVLLVSTDLDEILTLSSRIGVMYEGEILAEMPREDVDLDIIGKAMAGQRNY